AGAPVGPLVLARIARRALSRRDLLSVVPVAPMGIERRTSPSRGGRARRVCRGDRREHPAGVGFLLRHRAAVPRAQEAVRGADPGARGCPPSRRNGRDARVTAVRTAPASPSVPITGPIP